MMRYEDNEKLADNSACAGVRADLKMCLLESDCCKKVRKIISMIETFLQSNALYFRIKKLLENVYRKTWYHQNVKCFVIRFLSVRDL